MASSWNKYIRLQGRINLSNTISCSESPTVPKRPDKAVRSDPSSCPCVQLCIKRLLNPIKCNSYSNRIFSVNPDKLMVSFISIFKAAIKYSNMVFTQRQRSREQKRPRKPTIYDDCVNVVHDNDCFIK